MNRVLSLAIAGVVSTFVASAGCQDKHHDHNHDHAKASSPAAMEGRAPSGNAKVGAMKAAMNMGAARAEVEASKAPGMDDVKGVVEFVAAPDGKGVMVEYNIKGLTPDSKHGFHIHEKGDLSAPDFSSAGGHFNPDGHKHGGPKGDMRHGGDLGNITANDKGVAKGSVMAPGVTLDESKTGIIGRSIVVHEKADDLKSDPSGNSGPRIGAGVIKAMAAAPQGEKDAGNPAKQK